MTPTTLSDDDAPSGSPPAAAEAARDYHRVAEAIRYLEEHRTDQPELAAVAAHVDLSPHHFQRLFQRWAGVSPKRFLQHLTAEHAKQLLRGSATVLDAAWDSGLSGPGRLHDLMVNAEAVTPGEVKTGGEGVELRWARQPTRFGEAVIAVTERGICELAFLDDEHTEDAAEDRDEAARVHLRRRWPAATLLRDPRATASVARRLGEGLKRSLATEDGPLRLHLRGTNFQLAVWRALLAIPAGSAVSYGDVARVVGRPGASRAVGRAVGANPVAVLIPCHRVLRSGGGLGGYRWGTRRKRALLAWEASR